MTSSADILTQARVAIARGPASYAEHARNTLREALRLAGLDAANAAAPHWNPLGEIISPGDTVVLKPNFVRDFRETHAGHGDCTVTHGAIIRSTVECVFIALQGRGRIIIADAPQNDADFDALRMIAGLEPLQADFRREHAFEIEVRDLRPERARKIDGVIVGHDALPGDPAGYVRVSLDAESAFSEVNHWNHRLYGAEYDAGELHAHHHDRTHEYLIARTILDADVVINLPKLKTHKKVGLTVALKNLVGINGNKNWLPHHREGTPAEGGDQFDDSGVKRRVERRVVEQFKRLFPYLGPLRPLVAGPLKSIGKRVFGDTNTDTVRSGNWYGNDTTWRMVHDLNRILLYADAAGTLHAAPQRRVFTIVDGIIAGEGNGPLDATPHAAGVVVAGHSSVAVDAACARLMGFEPARVPLVARAFDPHERPLARFALADVTIRSNDPAFDGRVVDLEGGLLAFKPHFGWCDHVEWRPAPPQPAEVG